MHKLDKTSLTNWGGWPVVESEFSELPIYDDIAKKVRNSDEVIARGNGRCYGDSSLSETTISTLKLNKFLAFDDYTGLLHCQSGCILSEILEFSIPKGFFLPVTPGTKFITVGGALASDIHGKNHHSEGCFSNHVAFFHMMLSNGEIIKCSHSENFEVFKATAGGMGLTGIILDVAFRLKPIETSFIRQESIKARNLDEIMDLFEQSEDWTYTVSWIDCLASGKNIGKSILMRGEHAKRAEMPTKIKESDYLRYSGKQKLNIPVYFPNFTLNKLSIKAFNFLYYNKQFGKKVDAIMDYEPYFYPLDAVWNWNRIYGKNGFTQYQFVIPKNVSRKGLEDILKAISKSGEGSFLAVLKLFGKPNEDALISFPDEGYTLALDFKINKKVMKLLDELDIIIKDLGGRLYLTKDSRMQPDMMESGYDSLTAFKSYIDQDQFSKFKSVQSKRLSFH